MKLGNFQSEVRLLGHTKPIAPLVRFKPKPSSLLHASPRALGLRRPHRLRLRQKHKNQKFAVTLRRTISPLAKSLHADKTRAALPPDPTPPASPGGTHGGGGSWATHAGGPVPPGPVPGTRLTPRRPTPSSGVAAPPARPGDVTTTSCQSAGSPPPPGAHSCHTPAAGRSGAGGGGCGGRGGERAPPPRRPRRSWRERGPRRGPRRRGPGEPRGGSGGGEPPGPRPSPSPPLPHSRRPEKAPLPGPGNLGGRRGGGGVL